MADDHRAVGCKLEDRGLFCCLTSLGFLYFSNHWFPGASKCCDADNTWTQFVGGGVLNGDRVLHWQALKVGSVTNCSLISPLVYKCIFLTVQTYKHMRLTTQVYIITCTCNYHETKNHTIKGISD